MDTLNVVSLSGSSDHPRVSTTVTCLVATAPCSVVHRVVDNESLNACLPKMVFPDELFPDSLKPSRTILTSER